MDSISRHEQLLRVFHLIDILFRVRHPLTTAELKGRLRDRGVIDELSDNNVLHDIGATWATSQFRSPMAHAAAGATGFKCSHAPRGLRFAARDSSLHLLGGRLGCRPSRAAAAASSRFAKS